MAEKSLVPQGLLTDPSFVRAVGEGDWQTALHQLVEATSLTQVAIAAATGVSQSYVSRLMNGQSQEPGIGTVRSLCDGLGIPRPLAGLAPAQPEDPTNRRQVLGAGAGAAGLALLSAYGISSGGGDESLLAESTAILRRFEQHTPTRAVLGSAVAHSELTRVIRHRAGEGSPARRLSGVESEAAGFTAWLYADLDEQANARRYYRKAIKAASLSGNALLTCYMRGSLGQFATSVGAAAQGRELLTEARTQLPRSAPPIALLWLDALEATALAHLGERNALSILDSAERRMRKATNTEPVWPWLFHFDERKLAGYRAIVAGRLGHYKTAETYFAIADHTPASPKQKAMSTVARASIVASSRTPGAIDQACALAIQALATGRTLGSERVIRAVSRFRSDLSIARSTATTELDRQLSMSYEEDL
ncbi:helix-turn-helix transcriptional regulator [Hamadaea sp. NPDC051192]|uniref:helix-turn-helix domain-containing protein n=1 Tax=Hamadaea sp. NPDC051192 TaxID=3154940 RepID=UPI0034377A99